MEMNYNMNRLRYSVQQLINLIDGNPQIKLNAGAGKAFLQAFLNNTDNSREEIAALFNYLKSVMFDDMFVKLIAVSFEDWLIYLLSFIIDDTEVINVQNFISYQWRCIGLAKLMHLSVNVKRRVRQYFINKPAPFDVPDGCSNIAGSSISIASTFDIIKCCYQLLQADRQFFKDLWNWAIFFSNYVPSNYNQFNLNTERIYINHILSMLTNMNAVQLEQLNSDISACALVKFDQEEAHLKTKPFLPDLPIQNKPKIIALPFNSEQVTNVEGVFLTIFDKSNANYYENFTKICDRLVMVVSTKVNVRNVALGISSGKAICLSGPVGCGKTTIIHYLARKTGRISAPFNHPSMSPCGSQSMNNNNHKLNGDNHEEKAICNSNTLSSSNKRKSNDSDDMPEDLGTLIPGVRGKNGFLRVQLGDQTDSKMLLGQYICTDIPGEFIWLPGILTEAVMNGYWLLLEDLDCTTPDVYAIISNLLENNYLSVPGFRDCIKIAPEFQLFVTIRTHKSSTLGGIHNRGVLLNLLDKYLYTVNLMPLSRDELCKIISMNYPQLSTLANRVADIFLTFSRGEHGDNNVGTTENDDQGAAHSKDGAGQSYVQMPCERISIANITSSSRLVSTRDLMKFCRRSCPSFSATDAECAFFVFQNAIDIFCSYLPDSPEKTKLITNVGAKLGITPSRCQNYAEISKPEVLIAGENIKIGRITLCGGYTLENAPTPECSEQLKQKRQKLMSDSGINQKMQKNQQIFTFTRITSCLLERLAVCVHHSEPVLLVGETGVGKTSVVQYLAEHTRHKLLVVNMNNQSDVADLTGGFKPVDLGFVMLPIRIEFEMLFRQTFNREKNATFLHKFSIYYNQGDFLVLVKLMLHIMELIEHKYENNELGRFVELMPRWRALNIKLRKLNKQLSKSITMSFAFMPGALVNCVKYGEWILLDEINLASTETLECLSTVLEPDGSVVLLEQGDFTPVMRHPDFRIFACMNPSTDVGKKDLPISIRNRFTEFFVDEVSSEMDLNLLVMDYLNSTGIQRKSVGNLVKLFKRLKQLTELKLNDGLGNRPVYSLRTLCRSLRACAKNLCGSLERNLYESFCMSFLTQLDAASYETVHKLITSSLLNNSKAILNYTLPKPGENYVNIEGYWIQQGTQPLEEHKEYILTASVKQNLRNIARIISIGKLPILLQGPTSAGKTSLIKYIAQRTGNTCLRINNHEHTDLQEYVGVYTSDETGKLVFQEGVLVQAMRHGYWIILDELNLASTEILEALNRVLDDNREIFITENQCMVKAHPNFMLFATQNPPGLYGGRKTLSRAFKNRFVELHFCNIPRPELEIILKERCLIPASYASKMVSSMSDLQLNRKTSTKSLFTLRDLFRWGNRYSLANTNLLNDSNYDWNKHLVEEGFLVLSAKVRTALEIEIIKKTLQKHFKKSINEAELFDIKHPTRSGVTGDILMAIENFQDRKDIAWTFNMTRMAVLTAKALQFNEPALLVGPTGSGKTTVCQVLAAIQGKQLRILNCHMNTEGADFLGGLRPCRQSNDTTADIKENNGSGQQQNISLRKLFEWTNGPLIHAMQEGSYFLADEISLAEDSVLERLNCILEPGRAVFLSEKGGITSNVDHDDFTKEFIITAEEGFQFLATMNPGGDFGKKELSPALRNRFTEIWCTPSEEREDLIKIANICMNNYSLKMLNLEEEGGPHFALASYLVDVALYISEEVDKFKFSIRDILAWANYVMINRTFSFSERIIYGLETVFLDALEMLPFENAQNIKSNKKHIILYAIKKAKEIFDRNVDYVEMQKQRYGNVGYKKTQIGCEFGIKPFYLPVNLNCLKRNTNRFYFDAPTTKNNLFRLLSALTLNKAVLLEGPPGVGKTSIVESLAKAIGFNIVRINLCEHTDLADLFGTDLPAEDNIFEMAKECEKNTEEIQKENELSGKVVGSFAWRDGPLLAALKTENTWILLDELNLAPQPVLEGLNPILDHRNEVYLPELNKTFILQKQTRIFACQNPLMQGGGRKGLPQSFLNRFTKVYLSELQKEDLLHVVNAHYEYHFNNILSQFRRLLILDINCTIASGDLFDIYKTLTNTKQTVPVRQQSKQNIASQVALKCNYNITFNLSQRMVEFSERLRNAAKASLISAIVEINLRDILRWCELLIHPKTGFIFHKEKTFSENFSVLLLTIYERMKLIYHQRLRFEEDRLYIRKTFADIFQINLDDFEARSTDVALYWTPSKIYLNDIVLERFSSSHEMLDYKKENQMDNAFNEDTTGCKDTNTTMACSSLSQPLNNIAKTSPTLLLATQRENLKYLIESVHIDMPVILSGGNDTGKTKLIDALCKLSNQIYNTDIIDDSVTGSFQQIDINRHLEDISQHIESVYLKCLQRMSINFIISKTIMEQLMHSWSVYVQFSNSKFDFYSSLNATVVSPEIILFQQRLEKLQKVIDELFNKCKQYLTPNELNILKIEEKQLHLLGVHMSNTNTLNTGGLFEWVDSKIVKSLKFGQYIVLEHANLCNSAVLDRLNPIFETNGCLVLSEKGTTGTDNTIETVTKAKNFHAFLTMDPRNGELSRAMRNRCIEISLLQPIKNAASRKRASDSNTMDNGNESMNGLDFDDKRLLIYSLGIQDISTINCMIDIYNALVNLTEINNFNLTHLTRATFLTLAYLSVGCTTSRALFISHAYVYISTATIDYMGCGIQQYKQKIREIITVEVSKMAKCRNNGNPNGNSNQIKKRNPPNKSTYLNDMLLECDRLMLIDLIKWQMLPLRIAVEQGNGEDCAQTFAKHFNSLKHLRNADYNYNKLLEHLLYIFYSCSSFNDLPLRYRLVDQLVDEYPFLKRLSNYFHSILQQFRNDNHLKILPNDLPWNLKLFPRLRDYNDEKLDKGKMEKFANNLNAILITTLILPNQTPILVTSDPIQQINIINYSYAIYKGELRDNFQNSFLKYFTIFLLRFHELLKRHLENINDFDLMDHTQLFTRLNWWNRLQYMSHMKLLMNNQLNNNAINKLMVIFQWLEKHLINYFKDRIGEFLKNDKEFFNSWQQLTLYELKSRKSFNPLKRFYLKNFIYFPSYIRKEEIVLHNFVEHFNRVLNILPKKTALKQIDVFQKYLIQKSLKIRQIQIESSHQHFCYNIYGIQLLNSPAKIPKSTTSTLADDHQTRLSNLILQYNQNLTTNLIDHEMQRTTLKSISNICKTNLPPAAEVDGDGGGGDDRTVLSALQIERKQETGETFCKEVKILMMPLREYFFIKACLMKFNYNPLQTDLGIDEFNMDYCEQLSNLPTNIWLLFKSLNKSYYTDYRRLWFTIMDIIHHHQEYDNVKAFDDLLIFLNGNYRYLNTYHRLLLNDIQQLQFDNLSIRAGSLTKLFKENQPLEILPDYDGSQLLNAIAGLLFNMENSQPRHIPYQQLKFWQDILEQMQQLLWYNNRTMSSDYNPYENNWKIYQANGKRLLKEVKHIKWKIQNSKTKNKQNICDSLHGNDEILNRFAFANLLGGLNYNLAKFGNEATWLKEGEYIVDRKLLQVYKNSVIAGFLGALEICIFIFTPPLDPIEKKVLKRNCMLDDVITLKTLLISYDLMRSNLKTNYFAEDFYNILQKQYKLVEEKQKKYNEKLPLRPKESIYDKLRENIEHFINNNCTPVYLCKFIESLQNAAKKLLFQRKQQQHDAISYCDEDEDLNDDGNDVRNNRDFEAEYCDDDSNCEGCQGGLDNPINLRSPPPMEHHVTEENLDDLLKRINLWLANCHHFINFTLNDFQMYYQDFIKPLHCALNQLRLAFIGFRTLLIQLQLIHKNNLNPLNALNSYQEFKETLQNLIEFPNLHHLNIHQIPKNLLNLKQQQPSSLRNNDDHVVDDDKEEENFVQLLKAKLYELNNRVCLEQHINPGVFEELEVVFQIMQQIWQKEEQDRCRKEKEADSLYVQQKKCPEISEALIEQQEITEIFPTHLQNDYGDFLPEECNNDLNCNNSSRPTEGSSTSTTNTTTMTTTKKIIFRKIIDTENYVFLVKLFLELFQNYPAISKYTNNTNYENPKTKRPSLQQQQQQQMDFLSNYKIRLQVFMKLYANHNLLINDALDEEIFNALPLAVQIFRQEAKPNQQPLTNSSSNRNCNYNFYKDANISAVSDSLQILERIEKRMLELLIEFPEHAILMDIHKVIWRIRHLPFKAPLIRFNTGFQILRQKIAQWNEIAHKQIKLDEEETVVAQFVQKWTTMELQCWRNCLKEVQQRLEYQTYKYWFFIYTLINEYLTNDGYIDRSFQDMEMCRKRFIDEQQEEEMERVNNGQQKQQVDVNDILRILRQFLEAATFGDFHLRLSLIKSFETYLNYKASLNRDDEMKQSNCCRKIWDLITGLFNLHIYFDQFSKEINERKLAIRSPIEKKLKEFVKIESYNKDLSYFSMRNNVARVHRHLNKFLKNYQQELEEKILPVFEIQKVDQGLVVVEDAMANGAGDKSPNSCTNSQETLIENQQKFFKVPKETFLAASKPLEEEPIPDILPIPSSYTTSSQQSVTSNKKLIEKLTNHYKNARLITEDTLKSDTYKPLIQNLNDIFMDYLDYSKHLTSLIIDRKQERAKQIKQAKQILQQKRKALNDFFKTLTSIGINYKTGLMQLSVDECCSTNSIADSSHSILIKPFNIENILNVTAFKKKYSVKSKDFQFYSRNIKQLAKDLNNLYARCCFKFKCLQNRLLTPIAELGLPIIERLKGYSMDMFQLIQQQRQQLSESSNQLYDIHRILQHLYDIRQIIHDPLFTTATTSKDLMKSLQHLEFANYDHLRLELITAFNRILYVNEQFKLLLTCAPETDNLKNCLFTNTRYNLLSSLDNIKNLSTLNTDIIDLSQKMLNDLNSKSHQDFLSQTLINSYLKEYKRVLQILQDLLKLLKTTNHDDDDDYHYLPLAKPILDLLKELPQNLHSNPNNDFIITNDTTDDNAIFLNFPQEMEEIIHNILLGIQKLYKKYQKVVDRVRDDDEDGKEFIVPDFYLKKSLCDGLKADWETINLTNVTKQLSKLLLIVKDAPASKEKLFYVKKFINLLPLIEQFILIGDYYQYQQLCTHKISLKFLSAMLTIFVEISMKGFCIPPDLMHEEEMEKELMQQQNENDKFGLEDGTGEKDASDKIESEDQLDDAKRPEDRKNKEDDDEQEDCKEEKGIEMSEDFDGKIQDLAEKDANSSDDDGKDSEEENEEFDKEMAETEPGAEKLDEQIWGDDEDDDNTNDEPQNEETEGKGNNEQADTHNDLNAQNEINEEEGINDKNNKSDGLDATNDTTDNIDKNQANKKDVIDEMNDNEDVNEDQENPYHNELEEPPEPEDMDLDNMNDNSGDEREANDDIEMADLAENPFDIDKMKENMPKEEKEENVGGEDDNDNPSNDPNNDDEGADDDDSSDDGNSSLIDNNQKPDPNEMDVEPTPTNRTEEIAKEKEEEQQINDNDNNDEENNVCEEYRPSKDKSSKQDNVETVADLENDPTSFDNAVPTKANDKDIKQDNKMDEQDVGEEKNGIGQAENFDKENVGHEGLADNKETIPGEQNKNSKETAAEKRKQSNTNEERSLGEAANRNQVKRLKTIDKMQDNDANDDQRDEENLEQMEADEYQHIKEPKQTDKLTLDGATEEQAAKQICHQDDAEINKEDEENPKDDNTANEDDDVQMLIDDKNADETEEQQEEVEEMPAKNFDQNSKKEANKSSGKNREAPLETAKAVDVEGEIVATMTVPRNNDTTAHCNHNLLTMETNSINEDNQQEDENNDQALDTLKMKQMYLDQMQQQSNMNAASKNEDVDLWLRISDRMESSAREFCEQLRMILEPTKCSRFKGDYRSGRRINMKKIIPYIASQFRKDKIWLRRTKPAQRDYKITIAIDDSKSMDHNRSKILTLEAISLVGQALTLLESGQLSVLSFGEKPKIILNGIESFDGPKLVTNLNFNQNKTKIADLLDFVRTITAEQAAASTSANNGIFENLLLILSDGRNIYSEGKLRVNNAVKLARLQRIFLVYIIIDNPENKSSILDIQSMEMINKTVAVRSYLDEFPFPYYVIVRDLEQLPIVLSDAMRQWFELVNSE